MFCHNRLAGQLRAGGGRWLKGWDPQRSEGRWARWSGRQDVSSGAHVSLDASMRKARLLCETAGGPAVLGKMAVSKPGATAAGALESQGAGVLCPRHTPHSRPGHPGLCSSPATPQGWGRQLFPGLRQGCQPRWDWNLGWDSKAGPPRSSGVLIWGLHAPSPHINKLPLQVHILFPIGLELC